MHRFANPNNFLRIAAKIQPFLAVLSVVGFAVGIIGGLALVPPDYQQGDSARIMYIHVPAATMGMGAWGVMAVASFVALVWKHPLADLSAKAAAPLGAGFTFICLITGALWGKPMWGTWWVWDARLTSMLVLFFMYLGYMALVNAFDDPTRGEKAGNVLALVGVVNVIIVKFSVEWWNTLHQPASIMKKGGPAIDPSMIWPLFVMFGAYSCFFGWLLIMGIRAEIAKAKLRSVRLTQAQG